MYGDAQDRAVETSFSERRMGGFGSGAKLERAAMKPVRLVGANAIERTIIIGNGQDEGME